MSDAGANDDPSLRHRIRAKRLGVAAAAMIPACFLMLFSDSWGGFFLFASLQAVLGFAACVYALRAAWRATGAMPGRWRMLGLAAVAAVIGLGGVLAMGFFALAAGGFGMGGAWGRPLRLRGRVLHPELGEGSDWTRGALPDPSGLDAPTCAALEALWLHDAQKEHASVPAFSRVAWMLAAAGAPADLMEATHRAAIEEIEHTRLCFALARGYGGRSHTVEPMPALLVGDLDVGKNVLCTLAVESLKDGCLLEDFNADIAAACARDCTQPVTRRVLDLIAAEERDHAELSWRLVAWALARGGAPVRDAVTRALAGLAAVPRPTAATPDNQRRVDRADPVMMRAHGRLPDPDWARAWDQRLALTQQRATGLLASARGELERAHAA